MDQTDDLIQFAVGFKTCRGHLCSPVCQSVQWCGECNTTDTRCGDGYSMQTKPNSPAFICEATTSVMVTHSLTAILCANENTIIYRNNITLHFTLKYYKLWLNYIQHILIERLSRTFRYLYINKLSNYVCSRWSHLSFCSIQFHYPFLKMSFHLIPWSTKWIKKLGNATGLVCLSVCGLSHFLHILTQG